MKISSQISRHLSLVSFLATVLVVMTHVDDEMNPAERTYLESFLGGEFTAANVSNFFLISGYLLAHSFDQPKWWSLALVKRLWSLGVPYVLWCSVYALFYMAVSPVFSLPHDSWVELWHSLVKVFGMGPSKAPKIFHCGT